MSVVNLYIQPKVKQYLQTLKSRLKEEGVPISPYITQSNGGLMDAESAATSPVKTLFLVRQLVSSVRRELQHQLVNPT